MGLSCKPTGKFKSQLKKLENEAKKRVQRPKVEEVKSTAVDQ